MEQSEQGRDVASSRLISSGVVMAAAAMLLASSCSFHRGAPIPAGVPPPAGDPIPVIDIEAAGRPATQLEGWAAERAGRLGIPIQALEAYAYAAKFAETVNPGCHLSWTTLAGIGMVESHHGTWRGAEIAANGDVSPPIRGVDLDGTNGNLEIIDTEATRAAADGGPVYARAMGPMQFIPETWRLYGVDANNDGLVSPDNFDDAALSAAGYLCFRGKDMSTPRGWMNALRAYNHSDSYARTVRDWATAYADGRSL